MKRLLCCLAMALAAGAAQAEEPLTTIASLDVPRYLGTWYEISKFPNRFQRQCVSDTTATYALRPDGSLDVTNRCRKADGKLEEAHGQARQRGGPDSPRLQVRFAPAWLSFVPMVWGDYWVVDLDPEYSLVAVSEPRREYLWVLARSAQVPQERYQALLDRLARKGFKIEKLEMMPQNK